MVNKFIEILKIPLRVPYYEFLHWKIRTRGLFYKLRGYQKIENAKQIPIIINNRNRLTFLKLLIESLEEKGYSNIYIIDNASTYRPLLDFYENCNYPIFMLHKNLGHLALWKSGFYKKFIHDFYVYTDSDVVPTKECPDDFLEVFRDALEKDNRLYKVGFSLKIDDLPDCFRERQKVIDWERIFYKKRVNELFYQANIDTTFALYRPGMTGGASYLKMYRSAPPYVARHMPWYIDSSNLSEEEKYYIGNANMPTHWTKENQI